MAPWGWIVVVMSVLAVAAALICAELFRRALGRLARHATAIRRELERLQRTEGANREVLERLAQLWMAGNLTETQEGSADEAAAVAAFNDFATAMELVARRFGYTDAWHPKQATVQA